jgi:DNA polymerase-3 subunit epsilon
MAKTLEGSGDYRVLRRLDPRVAEADADGGDLRTALFIDVETTGLDTAKDEVIEIAAVPFAYGADGRIFEIRDPFHGFRDPGRPIPPGITAINGITNEMVAGHNIDVDALARLAESAAPIISHNAAFDRPFSERLSDVFALRPWACSMSQIDWPAEGYSSGTRLEYLAMRAGFFYNRHHAIDDCMAGIAMLASVLPVSGAPALSKLLECGRRATLRIWAQGSPFESKDLLKDRGYRWYAGRKCWAADVDEELKQAEIAWLCQTIYRRNVAPVVQKITAFDRFSIRAECPQ